MTCATLLLLAIMAAAHRHEPEPAPVAPPTRELTFRSAAGAEHAARLWLPAPLDRTGCAVLLIGGGSVTDLHWTVPPTIPGENDQPQRTTIDGQPTRDADTIALALARRGHIVMQWSSIRADEPMLRENPALAAGIPYPDSVELARAALALLRAQPEVDPDRIVLVGHSLGAMRACHIADDGVHAMVLLAGAYLGKVRGSPSGVAASYPGAIPGLDADGDAVVSREELAAWHKLEPAESHLPRTFDEMDHDADGVLRGWELAAADILARADRGDPSALHDRPTVNGDLRWPADLIRASPTPILSLHGGLDPLSINAPLLAHHRFEHVEIVYLPHRGHQLSPVDEHGRTGPISPEAVARIAAWIDARCIQPTPARPAADDPSPASAR